ncbi:flagellin [Paraburkholderia sacchari]|uniref:flagellin N-terminal helical domain-containing protein n=1 Tax=Paraburkholderia sacchari TaxID=159450 RepID=UPI000541EB06|nr:flagellin [Paraburkholderia sacchari]NLP60327.1 flagellin [Paraburkholderia sacchari]
MLGINSNINSLVAQQNLTSSGSALSQAITRLSSGKRINSAADDAAGLAISNIMQTQINGLNQGVSNANDGVSMVQTASSGLSSLTNSLQRIRQLATQASNGSMTNTDRQALQQEVSQQVSEINRIASQTTYNGMNVLNGSLGNVSFQVGANVGQTINMNLSQSVSAASLGGGLAAKGTVLGTYTGLSLDPTSGGAYSGTGASVTSINVIADGNGGFQFTDQNNTALSAGAQSTLFSGVTTGTGTALTLTTSGALAANNGASYQAAQVTAANQAIGAISATNSGQAKTSLTTPNQLVGQLTGLNLNADGSLNTGAQSGAAITSIQVYTDGSGGYRFAANNSDVTQTPNQLSSGVLTTLGLTDTANGTATDGDLLSITGGGTLAQAGAFSVPASFQNNATTTTSIDANNTVSKVSTIDISTQTGANQAIQSIDSALNTVNNMQANLGAAQNRFSAISTTQQAQSTDLSQAQSQIQDANFAAETAALSKAQVLQQAGISVLAQANSQPQQILKLLQ